MPGKSSKNKIEEKLKKGDKLISSIRKKGIGKTGKEQPTIRRWDTIQCGKCNKQFELVMGKSYQGNCESCNRMETAEKQKIPIESYDAILTSLGFTINHPEDYIDQNTKLSICCPNMHIMNLSIRSFYHDNSCTECTSVHVQVPKGENQHALDKKNQSPETIVHITPQQVLEKIEQFDGYVIIILDEIGVLYKCNNNHPTRYKLKSLNMNADLSCKSCKLAIQSTLQAFDKKLLDEFLKDCGLKLLSNYVNSETLMELECIKCQKIFYNCKNNIRYDKNNPKIYCKYCLEQDVTIPRKKQDNITKGNAFKTLMDEDKLGPCIMLDDPAIYETNRTLFNVQCKLNESHKFTTYWDNYVNRKRRCPHCTQSTGETLISQYLDSLGIKYVREYKFDEDNPCKDQKDLPFDFYITDESGYELIIEFDGEQHFREVGHFGGANALAYLRRHDLQKTRHCALSLIPILRIAHKDVETIPIHINEALIFIRTGQCKDVIIYSDPKYYSNFIQDYSNY